MLIVPEVHAFARKNMGGGTNNAGAHYADGGGSFVTADYPVPRSVWI
jgi:hypothetical protein